MQFWKPGTVAPGSNTSKERPNRLGVEADLHADESFVLNVFPVDVTTPLDQVRSRLPVYKHRHEFLYLMETCRVVIVAGQTGSGKTTQLPQYLYEAGWTRSDKAVACTQPRRVAATSVATRVAEEMGTSLGTGLVGYSVRFESQSTEGVTRIKYMTDGMLFREILFDPLLERYSVIMIDEAHERSLYTDILLALLKKILRRRPELKIIISSATMDALQFQNYFGEFQPKILTVQGRMHPVETFYMQEETFNIVEEVADTIVKILRNFKDDMDGDMLVFLPGQDDILKCIAFLNEVLDSDKNVSILPLYAALPMEEQMRVFSKSAAGVRKVILATNIAETSVTIDGITFVIDCGTFKQKVHDPLTGLDVLVNCTISKASAKQRAGRAGRIRPGKVFRLYTNDQYNSFLENTIPEIQKCNLTTVLLQLKALGIDNIVDFDFMSPPSPPALARALEFLYALNAVDDYGRLTREVGIPLSELPLEPALSRILLASRNYQCGAEAVTIVAMLAAQPIFSNNGPSEAKRKVTVEEGDLLTFVNVYRHYLRSGQKWCHRHSINSASMAKAHRIRALLCQYMKRYGLRPEESAGTNVTSVLKCLVSGFFANTAVAQADGSYKSIRGGTILYIHPSSGLFKRVPECVVYYEAVETGKAWMRLVTVVDQEWLAEIAPNYYQFKTIKYM